MAIRFVEIKASESVETLNSEWVILENDGKAPFNTRGCGMTVGRKGHDFFRNRGVSIRKDHAGLYSRLNYRAAAGVNPGSNINDPSDDRGLRYPDRSDLGAQFRLILPRLVRGPITQEPLPLEPADVARAEVMG